MEKFSKNKKYDLLLNRIYDYILDSDENVVSELKRYKKEYPHEPDYNYAQFGNMLIYLDDVRELLIECGYKSEKRMADDRLWAAYRWNVRKVIDYILK